MKIGIISTAIPLVSGGGRFICDWLHEKLIAAGHESEIVYIPFTEERPFLLPQMAAMRLWKLDTYFERIITIRPPAHLIPHPNKVIWFIHHLRGFYDLWDTEYCGVPHDTAGFAMRDAIRRADDVGLSEAQHVFTNSKVVSERLQAYNGVKSEVLYPPVLNPENFGSGKYGDEIVSVCRIEHHKRQHLLIEALAHTQHPVRLRLSGLSMNADYISSLHTRVGELGLTERVVIDERWVTEQEKADMLRTALASAYVPFDEDSYGYPTIEAAHSRRSTITVSDAGGVSEFVVHGQTGLISEPEPIAVAAMMDRLYGDRKLAKRMGAAAEKRITTLGIQWDNVIAKLLG